MEKWRRVKGDVKPQDVIDKVYGTFRDHVRSIKTLYNPIETICLNHGLTNTVLGPRFINEAYSISLIYNNTAPSIAEHVITLLTREGVLAKHNTELLDDTYEAPDIQILTYGDVKDRESFFNAFKDLIPTFERLVHKDAFQPMTEQLKCIPGVTGVTFGTTPPEGLRSYRFRYHDVIQDEGKMYKIILSNEMIRIMLIESEDVPGRWLLSVVVPVHLHIQHTFTAIYYITIAEVLISTRADKRLSKPYTTTHKMDRRNVKTLNTFSMIEFVHQSLLIPKACMGLYTCFYWLQSTPPMHIRAKEIIQHVRGTRRIVRLKELFRNVADAEKAAEVVALAVLASHVMNNTIDVITPRSLEE